MIQQAAIAKIVGREGIDGSSETLEAYSRDVSFVSPVRPACVVQPRTAEAVQKLVQRANKTKTLFVPVRSGPPHFRAIRSRRSEARLSST